MDRRKVLKNSLLLTGLMAISSKPSFAKIQTNSKILKRKSIIRKVAQLGNKCLRTKSENVIVTNRVKNTDLGNLIDDMLITLSDSDGVGMAATQIFEDLSLFLFAREKENYTIEIAINPKIIRSSKEMKKGYEGCLSVPGIRAMVPRYKWIDVEYIDGDNSKVSKRYSGFIARIFQHEFDHLNGIVYLDRLESNKDIISEEEYQKLPEEAKKRE